MSMATVRTNDSFDHWWDAEGRKRIILLRRSIRTSTKRYVDDIPYIEGAPSDPETAYPLPFKLAKIYVGLVKGELAHHDDQPEDALWTGLLFGPCFQLLWSCATALPVRGLKIPDNIKAYRGEDLTAIKSQISWMLDFVSALPDYTIEDWIAIETLETAEILARAYAKAYVELAVSCDEVDPIVIRHHAAMLGEIIADMLNLVMQSGERTDLRLPDTHLHKQIATRQATLRQPKAAPPWY